MIGVKHNLKDTDFSNFLSLLLILHSTESISNKVGNELGILELLEFKENFRANFILFLYRCTKRMKTVLAVWY